MVVEQAVPHWASWFNVAVGDEWKHVRRPTNGMLLASSHFNQLFAGPTSQARLAVVTVMLAMIAAVLKFWILWPCIKWLIGTVAWLARIMVCLCCMHIAYQMNVVVSGTR